MDIGVDIIDISRFKRAVERWGDFFLQRIFTDREILAYRDRAHSLAVRFAGKEAFYKALGDGTLMWREIEILGKNKPEMILHGKTKEQVKDKKISISLSHEKNFGVAVVLIV